MNLTYTNSGLSGKLGRIGLHLVCLIKTRGRTYRMNLAGIRREFV